MTLDELKNTPAADISTNSWLREMCIQLAGLNEAFTAPAAPKPMPEVKRGPDKPRKVVN